jgi:hypothetical protein
VGRAFVHKKIKISDRGPWTLQNSKVFLPKSGPAPTYTAVGARVLGHRSRPICNKHCSAAELEPLLSRRSKSVPLWCAALKKLDKLFQQSQFATAGGAAAAEFD